MPAVAALDATALVTLAQATDYLKLGSSHDKDHLVAQIVNSVSAWMEHEYGRVWNQRTLTGELYHGTGTHRLMLREFPVKAADVTKVEFLTIGYPLDGTWTEQSRTNLLVEPQTDQVLYLADQVWPKGQWNVRMSYKPGYTAADLPEPVKQGCLQVVEWVFKGQDRQSRGVESMSFGQQSVKYSTGAMHPDTAAVLEPYRHRTQGS